MKAGSFKGTRKGLCSGAHRGLSKGLARGALSNDRRSSSNSSDPIEYRRFAAAMFAAGDPVPTDYRMLYINFINWAKTTLCRNGTNVYWDVIDYIRLECTYSKKAALCNLKNPTQFATIVNDYGGSFIRNEGLKGNGSMYVDTGFNPTATGNKYVLNNACCCVFSLDDIAEVKQDLSNLSSGSGSYIAVRQDSSTGYDFVGAINGAVVTNATQTNISGRSWCHVERSTSASQRTYVNGFRTASLTSASDATLVNHTFYEFSDVALTGLYSTKTHACIYFGSANIEQNILISGINRHFIYPLQSRASIRNRVLFLGDSMTGDETQATTSLSVLSQYPIRTLSNLGTTNWMGVVNANANREVVGTVVVTPSISGGLAVEVLGGTGGQQSFKNFAVIKDVVVMFAGTNDLAFNAVTSALTLYNGIVSVGNQIKAAGFKFIVVGIPNRDGGYQSGQIKANFDTANSDYRSRMAADFGVSTSVTNVYSPASATYADLWINIYADSRFANENDTTYFQVDKIHLNSTGYNAMADDLIAPAINLLT